MSNLDRPQSILNIHDYISEKTFVIPNYQRGYKWGVPPEKKDGRATCSVKFLLECIIDAQKKSKDKKDDKKKIDYFIQGVTVTENNGEVVLIDGQQRTTTLYLLLKYLGYDQLPTIKYDIRKETHNFLKDSFIENGELKSKHESNESQDIFYLNKAIKTIHSELSEYSDDSKIELRQYILENVKLFYITIDENEATKVFSMLNGQKAEMKQAELIKAELLRLVSKNENSNSENHKNNEWEINQARSKYAREWDRWNYWWNREEVKNFYGSSNNAELPIDFLLKNFFYLNDDKLVFSFKSFKGKFLNNPKSAKINFKKLRDLQKTFEDWFNDIEKHNYLGLIIKCTEINRKDVFEYLIDKKDIKDFKNYAKWALVGATHEEIIKTNNNQLEQRTKDIFSLLEMPNVYDDNNKNQENNPNITEAKEHAYKQLLRRNVDMDTQLKRRFDFSIWKERSLEHIHAQKSVDGKLECANDIYTHSIGNLVLLYKSDNSSLSNSSFNHKKNKLFLSFINPNGALKSMSLLHTVSVFANEKWEFAQIEENQKNFLKEFRKTYELGEKP